MTAPRPAELDDGATRRLAQDEFVRPVVVEAGAGTGKTALLVARVAAWCVGAGWQRHAADDAAPETVARRVIERVVAITFTEAAAAEMASRIAEALVGLGRGTEPVGWAPGASVRELEDEELAARATALAGAVHRLQVTTIHAYCQGVLAAHPFDAGLHPRFEVDADGSALEGVVDDVVEEALRRLDESPDDGDWEIVAEAGVGPIQVAEALRLLVAAGARPAELEVDPFGDGPAAELRDGLARAFADFFAVEAGRLATVPRSPAAGEAREALADAARRLDALGGHVAAAELQGAVGDLAGKPLQRLRKWAKDDLTQGERGQLDDAVADVVAAAGRLLDRVEPLLAVDLEAFGAARRLLLELLREVDARRRVAGLVTFTDLLERTADLLEQHREISRTERSRIDQLLVDEFQDTDDVQCRIVARLALQGPAPDRPGLFIVGDPKQSIYAWRSADLEAYDRFVGRVVDGGGVRGPLTRNFRSAKPILDEVERVVAPVMHREEGLQPCFESLDATGERRTSPGFEHAPWSAVEHWVCWPLDDDGVPQRRSLLRHVTELEAGAIAADVRRLHDEAGVRFGDVAVLLRATTAMAPLLEALRARGVPFEVSREREYYRQREIVEAAALVRAVLEPADVLALLTVIRSDVVGVPDAALAPLWAAGLPAAAAALDGVDRAAMRRVRELVRSAAAAVEPAPGAGLLPSWPDALIGGLEIVAELRRSIDLDPPDLFVERLRTLWLAEAAAAARSLGRFRQARLDGFFADLEQALRHGGGASAELARFLRRAVEEGREAPTASEPDREADAVHVMTVYGAKGLDFEHVYLAQIHKRTGGWGAPPAAELRRFRGRTEMALFGWPTPGFAGVERHREIQSRAERVRLLYVAMTRAKQRLVVSGGWAEPGAEVDPLEAATVAELVARRADRDVIDDLIARRVDREASREPAVSWVLPALDEDLGPPDGGEPGRIADPSRAAEDADVIARARAAAALRMSRPWSVAASDAAHRSDARLEGDGGDDDAGRTPGAAGRGAAAVVGTTVHRLLETLDLDGDLPAQIDDRRASLNEAVGVELAADQARPAFERLDGLLTGLAGGVCLARLAELAPHVVARELAVFLKPDGDDGTSVVSGAVDLVYTDPDDGRLVIADYKTDAVASDDDVRERVETYRPQLATYSRALEQALDLDRAPHTELWFLSADRIVRLT